MIYTLIIILFFILFFLFKSLETFTTSNQSEKKYIDKLLPFYREIQEIDIPGKTFEKNCNEYKFNEINKNFYTDPKFLFPREACISQCMQGVWFGDDGDDHTSDKRGYLPCCEKACDFIK